MAELQDVPLFVLLLAHKDEVDPPPIFGCIQTATKILPLFVIYIELLDGGIEFGIITREPQDVPFVLKEENTPAFVPKTETYPAEDPLTVGYVSGSGVAFVMTTGALGIKVAA